jgi:hypothetical protein
MVVSLNTPQEMVAKPPEDLSVWLYCVIRDAQRLNDPPVSLSATEPQLLLLPLRLHYPMTTVTNRGTRAGDEAVYAGQGAAIISQPTHPTQHGFIGRIHRHGRGIEDGSCWIPGAWMSRWHTQQSLSPSSHGTPYFSMVLKMKPDAQATLVHKATESNKSASDHSSRSDPRDSVAVR